MPATRRTLSTTAAATLTGAAAFALRRRAFALALRVRPPQFAVRVEHNVPVAMPDGVRLATDIYRPVGVERGPVVLIRTPYTRGGMAVHPDVFFANRFAERGYFVVCQDVRGCGDSEGEFEPFVHEAADGRATAEWIVAQPWCDGNIGMWGESYVGYTQWAAAAAGAPGLKALFPVITSARLIEFPAQGLHLDTLLRWLFVLDGLASPDANMIEKLRRSGDVAYQDRALGGAFMHLPLATVDEAAFRHPVAFYRRAAGESDPGAAYWQEIDHTPAVAAAPPAHIVSGWYDVFLPASLADYAAQVAAGKRPALTVGPWTHLDSRLSFDTFRHALAWFDAHLAGDRSALDGADPVNVYVMGEKRWRSFPAWPPAGFTVRWFLGGMGAAKAGTLYPDNPPPTSLPDRYRYDPANPTPSLGGPLLATKAGPKDNRPLETRADVLTYTSLPLSEKLTIIGPVQLELFVESSTPYTDFFGRLLDVHPDGRSVNLCEGHVRLHPAAVAAAGVHDHGVRQADGSLRLVIDLGATAHQFPRGHRIRLHVCSGAHPRIARNLGTGDPLHEGTRMVPADQTVHDAAHPSALVLPLMRW